MFVETILPVLQKKLVTIKEDATTREAASLMLRQCTDILVVCSSSKRMVGIITKTDLIRQMGICQGASCIIPLSQMITRDVVACHLGDRMQVTWELMKSRGLKNIPVIDGTARIIGVLNARDALDLLRQEVQHDEELLRDYVMCVGYH
jgi:CBS domain-containing protein